MTTIKPFRSLTLALLVCSLAACGRLPAVPSQPAATAASGAASGAATAIPAAPAEPQANVIQEWDFAAAQQALGWRPANDLAGFDFDAGGLLTQATGGDPYLIGPPASIQAAAARHVEIRMRSTRGNDAQLFWESDGVAFNEPASLHFQVNPDGAWHTYRVPVRDNPNWKNTITRLRLDPTTQPGGDIGVASIRVIGPLPARLVVARFAPRAAFGREGRPLEVQAVIRNTGDQPAGQVALDVRAAPEARARISLAAPIGAIQPGGTATATWVLDGLPPGVFPVSVWMGDQALRETQVIVLSVAASEAADAAVSGDHIRLRFRRQPFGYGVGTVEWRPDGADWRVVGSLQSLGEVVYAGAQGEPRAVLLFAPDVRASATELQFTASFTAADGLAWTSHITFSLASDAAAGVISITQSLAASGDGRLLAWRGPKYLPGEGEGAFGAARDSALFPGLEYLLAGDQSSSDRYAAAPNNLRYVPHPNKITIPLMSVAQGGVATGLMWNPLQGWDAAAGAAHDRPAALFASPNTWDGQPNHAMQLFVPGVTAGLTENADRLEQPYRLPAGASLTLEATLFAAAAPDSIAPVQFWLERIGLPGVPDAPAALEVMKRSLDTYQQVVWVAASRGWHYVLQDPWGPGYNPGIALHLWLGTLDPDLKATTPLDWRETARGTQASPPAGGQPNPWYYDPAFLLQQIAPDDLGAARALARLQVWQQAAWGDVSGQRDDGAWGFTQSSAGTPRFGAEGDTSNGYTAARAYHILYVARISGDAQLAAAGLKALAFLDQQPLRPEGAQTWELSLHVPDVLASAWVVQSFVEGYRLTGDRHYLDQAQRWALAGLPFVYLWNPVDRPVMRYGAIPVFGATNYTYPWFGRPVMWNGLDYAIGLQSLSAELAAAGMAPAADWRRVAEGISAVTAQMQSPDPAFLGMYPDAWDAVAGSEAYTWWLAPTYLMQNEALLRGIPGAQVNTRAVTLDGQTLRVSAAAELTAVKAGPDRLSVSLRYYRGETTGLAVTPRMKAPARVAVDGAELGAQDWSYSQGWLLVRVPFTGGDTASVEINW